MYRRTVTSWNDFEQVVNEFLEPSGLDQHQFLFRGQSNVKWDLRPTLLRDLPPGMVADRMHTIEEMLITQFKRGAHVDISTNEFVTTQDNFSWLAMMQHFGAPTRLLDWSESAYVGCYFAVHGTPNNDGAIWIVDSIRLKTKMDHRHPDYGIPTEFEDVDRWLSDRTTHGCLRYWHRAKPMARMIAQQGGFTISPDIMATHDEILNEVSENAEPNDKAYAQIIISAKAKPELAHRLREMNVTAAALFPGIDGLGRSFAEYFTVLRNIPI